MGAVGPGRRPVREEALGLTSERPPRTFVPVESSTPEPPAEEAGTAGSTDGAVAHAAGISPATGAASRVPGTWWLWGDPEPWPDL